MWLKAHYLAQRGLSKARPKAKGANIKMDFTDEQMSLPNIDCDASINLCLPVLILANPEAMEFPKVKSGCDLSRSLKNIKDAELVEKQDSKQRATELKWKPDEQVCIPEHLLKHMLKERLPLSKEVASHQ